MKKFTSFLAITMIAMLTLVSCGGDDEDPQPAKPVKTDLEKVQDGIIGKWEFISAEITKNGETLTYNGECDFSGKPTWYQSYAQDTDYTFSSTNVSKFRNCENKEFKGYTYSVVELNKKFTISIKTSGGADYESFNIVSDPDNVSTGNIKVNLDYESKDPDVLIIITFKKAS
jgi:hypothetical protein